MHLFACSVPPTTFQLPASSEGIQNAYGKGRQGKILLRFAEGRCQLRGAPSLHLTEEGRGKERDSKSIYLPERRPRRKQPSGMPCAPRLQSREQKMRETKRNGTMGREGGRGTRSSGRSQSRLIGCWKRHRESKGKTGPVEIPAASSPGRLYLGILPALEPYWLRSRRGAEHTLEG